MIPEIISQAILSRRRERDPYDRRRHGRSHDDSYRNREAGTYSKRSRWAEVQPVGSAGISGGTRDKDG